MEFIDPFGATGAPFHIVRDILRSPSSEVLINLDVDGIARIHRAGSSANATRHLDEIFGDSEWENSLTEVSDFRDQCRQILGQYRRNLLKLDKVRYTFSFEMRSHSGLVNYYLVFASQHPLGLEKMKEAMKKVDQTGTYQFNDAHVNQHPLFRQDDPEHFGNELFNHFRGKTVRMEELRDFALNETPFTNPKKMLKFLEEKGAITVFSKDSKRKKGVFPDEKIDKIKF